MILIEQPCVSSSAVACEFALVLISHTEGTELILPFTIRIYRCVDVTVGLNTRILFAFETVIVPGPV